MTCISNSPISNFVYAHLIPQCLTVFKHEKNQYFAYLQYDSYCYGNLSAGLFCRVRIEKRGGIWRMDLCEAFNCSHYGFVDFIDALNYVVFEYMKLDLDSFRLGLVPFEKKDIFFDDLDLKINGLRITSQITNLTNSSFK